MKIDIEKIQMDYGSIKNYCLKNNFKIAGNIHKLFKKDGLKASYRWTPNTQSQRLREALYLGGYLIAECEKDIKYLESLKIRLEWRKLKEGKKDGAVTELF